jgi:hypothetical protein
MVNTLQPTLPTDRESGLGVVDELNKINLDFDHYILFLYCYYYAGKELQEENSKRNLFI